MLVHLDPRLKDGSSAAEILSEKIRLLEKRRFERQTWSSREWSLSSAGFPEDRDKNGEGLLVRRKYMNRGPMGALRIERKGPFRALPNHIIEIDLLLAESGRARLMWRRDGERRDVQHWVEAQVTGKNVFQTLRFKPGSNPEWHGDLGQLRIEPEWENKMGVVLRLRELRILEAGFNLAHAPLGIGYGDGGLVEIAGEARRAWPADFSIPLYTKSDIPSNGLFMASCALVPGGTAMQADFVLDVLVPGGKWKRAASDKLSVTNGWQSFNADLSSFSGEGVRLRMSVLQEKGQPLDDREPERACAFWGEPMILNTGKKQEHPNVLLVTIDTTRADHVGDPRVTPRLARLGDEGIVFENAWAGCNSTTPSHASILTGTRVREHGAQDNRSMLHMDNNTIAELFREAGYHTAAAVSVRHLQSGTGFGQGFDRFRSAVEDSNLDGSRTIEPVLSWMESWKGEPFFMWIHLFDPHIPYGPPEAFKSSFAENSEKPIPSMTEVPPTVPEVDEEVPVHLEWLGEINCHDHVKFLYSAGVGYADHLVDRLLCALEKARILKNTAVVVTADHGESLGEHGIWYDHAGLFNESLKIPMIIKIPGGPEGARVADPVSCLDIAPTLVALCGLEPDRLMRGMNLIGIAEKGGDPDRKMWFEYPRLMQVGFRDKRCHFITTLESGLRYGLDVKTDPEGRRLGSYARISLGKSYLFEIGSDPNLENNLADTRKDAVDACLKKVRKWQESLVPRCMATERDLSEEDEKRLQALGYGGG